MENEEFLNILNQYEPSEILGFKSKFGVTLELTLSLFQDVIYDSIEKIYLESTKCSICQQIHSKLNCTDIFLVDEDGKLRTVSPVSSLPIGSHENIECAVCGRNIASTKYAPHLEKCLGMGRNAARNINKKYVVFYIFFVVIQEF